MTLRKFKLGFSLDVCLYLQLLNSSTNVWSLLEFFHHSLLDEADVEECGVVPWEGLTSVSI
jgi:hypothetical protein